LAAKLPDVEAARSPEFEDRRRKWGAEQRPETQAAHWALDRAVAASLRIEQCEQAVDEHVVVSRERARLAWDQDRRAEVARLANRLGQNPVLVSRELQTSLAGVELMIEAWLGLAAGLQDGGDWSESQASSALDLLGVAVDLRSGPTLLDPMDGSDPRTYRKTLAFQELERLEGLRDEAMEPLDDLERQAAMTGHSALLSKPAQLLLRYERDAWRRYREAMKELQEQREVEAAPTPVAAPSPTRIVSKPAAELDRPEAKRSSGVATVVVAAGMASASPAPVLIPVTERSQFDDSRPNPELARDRP
jgi:hypothetical protein